MLAVLQCSSTKECIGREVLWKWLSFSSFLSQLVSGKHIYIDFDLNMYKYVYVQSDIVMLCFLQVNEKSFFARGK